MSQDKLYEKRRSKRYEISNVRVSILSLYSIEVLNISIDGMAIETEKRLELNRVYTFKFHDGDKILNLRGKVVWALLISKEDEEGTIKPVYKAGIRFLDTYTEKAAELTRFIEEKRLKTVERRLGGVRFRIAVQNNIKVNYPQEYKVKKLSLSGMLIETTVPYDVNSYHDVEMNIDGNLFTARSRVAYCKKVIDDKLTRFDMGLEFVEMSSENRKILKDFIAKLESI
jgi:c-di-GMP-binding flagellar brake protein YcgR